MSRYIFTPKGISNLKKSVHQTVNLIDNFYWVSRFASISAYEGNPPSNTTVDLIFQDQQNIRFKPKPTLLLNLVSKVFGYRDFTEMNTVSKSQAPSDYLCVGDSDYAPHLAGIFCELMSEFFRLNEQTSCTAKIICKLVVNAWELNKDLYGNGGFHLGLTAEKGSKSYFKDLEILYRDGEWLFSTSLLGAVERIKDDTLDGSLLPVLAFYEHNFPETKSDLNELHMLHLMIGEDLDNIRANAASVVAYSRLTTDGTGVYLLPHHHSIRELLVSSRKHLISPLLKGVNSKHSSILLAYLSQLQPLHRSKHEMAAWFLNPHTVTERVQMFKMEQVSKIKFSDGSFSYARG
ncbi:hypothetical protein [Vibrio sp. D431a]|uniref:hypothetical protein n=1 Tax=Vibrio sp. D431a TaxID=2837388 RepID=UPI002553CEA3|nr:hypothetical protein [Vibrio sp. D431a]MDK9789769.1 hypothetical protein [Vibrio sp. D431a]